MDESSAIEKKRGRPPVELADNRLLNDEHLLRKIAQMYYYDGVSQEFIASQVAMSRQLVGRALQRARELGIVRITITPHERTGYLQNLTREARSLLGLDDLVIVPGHGITMTPSDEQDKNDDVVADIAATAQEYLDQMLADTDVLAVSGGKRFLRTMLRYAHPTRTLEHLHVVASIGFVDEHTSTGDANLIAYDLAAMYGANHSWFPCPAFMGSAQQVQVVREMPIVSKAYALMYNASLLVTSVWEPEFHSLVEQGYMHPEQEAQLQALHPVADINHWLFDAEGRCLNTLLDPSPYFLTGLEVPLLKQRIQDGETRVILVVGGDPTYIPAIRAVIKAGLVSILITDHITVQQLVHYN